MKVNKTVDVRSSMSVFTLTKPPFSKNSIFATVTYILVAVNCPINSCFEVSKQFLPEMNALNDLNIVLKPYLILHFQFYSLKK